MQVVYPVTQADFGTFLVALVGGQMLDAVTTIFIVTMGGSEMNPVISSLLGGGYLSLVLGKLVLSLAVGAGVYSVSKTASRYFPLTVSLALTGTFFGAFSNVITIGTHFL